MQESNKEPTFKRLNSFGEANTSPCLAGPFIFDLRFPTGAPVPIQLVLIFKKLHKKYLRN